MLMKSMICMMALLMMVKSKERDLENSFLQTNLVLPEAGSFKHTGWFAAHSFLDHKPIPRF